MNNINAYRLIPGGSPARLAILRATADQSASNRNPDTRLQPGNWREARATGLDSYDGYFGTFSGGGGQWYSHQGEYFRNERNADNIVHSLPHGWYTGTDANEIAIGIVASLPHNRFLAGYRWTCNDERVYYPEIFDDEDDAARAAGGHAEAFADLQREDSERFDAMTLAEFNADGARAEVEKTFALRHHPKFGGFDRVREAIEECREALDTLADATRAYERG